MQIKLSEFVDRVTERSGEPREEVERTILSYFECVREAMIKMDKNEVYFQIGSFKLSKKKIRKYITVEESYFKLVKRSLENFLSEEGVNMDVDSLIETPKVTEVIEVMEIIGISDKNKFKKLFKKYKEHLAALNEAKRKLKEVEDMYISSKRSIRVNNRHANNFTYYRKRDLRNNTNTPDKYFKKDKPKPNHNQEHINTEQY